MAKTIRVVEYFYAMVPNKPGEAARMLNTLKDAGVNLLAFSGFPERRRSQLDFIPADAAAFKQAARQAKWKTVGPKKGFLLQGDDRVGAIADILDRLGTAKINVTAIDAVTDDGRYGAIFWVAAKDVKKTAALLDEDRPGTFSDENGRRTISEELVGTISHYFAKPQVGVVKLTADIKVGDTLRFSGHGADFQQALTSMQLDHVSVKTASSRTAVAIKVAERVREGTEVYRIML